MSRRSIWEQADDFVEEARQADLGRRLSSFQAEIRRSVARDAESNKKILTEQYFGAYWDAGNGGSVGSIEKQINDTIGDFSKRFMEIERTHPYLKQQFPGAVQSYGSSLGKVISLSKIVQEYSSQIKRAIQYNPDKTYELYEQLMKNYISNYDLYKQETDQALSRITHQCSQYRPVKEVEIDQAAIEAASVHRAQEHKEQKQREADEEVAPISHSQSAAASASSMHSSSSSSSSSSLTPEQLLRLEIEAIRKHYQEAMAAKEEEVRNKAREVDTERQRAERAEAVSSDKDKIIADRERTIELQTKEKAEKELLLKREMDTVDDLRGMLKWTRESAEKQKAEAFELGKLKAMEEAGIDSWEIIPDTGSHAAASSSSSSSSSSNVSATVSSFSLSSLMGHSHHDPVDHMSTAASSLLGAEAQQHASSDF